MRRIGEGVIRKVHETYSPIVLSLSYNTVDEVISTDDVRSTTVIGVGWHGKLSKLRVFLPQCSS
jgi:hypothetical protein